MTAQIIQFPRKTPLERHELPEHWSEYLKGHYIHCTYDGWKSHEETFRYCEAMSRIPPQGKDESYDDYLLRRARVAIGLLPKRKRS